MQPNTDPINAQPQAPAFEGKLITNFEEYDKFIKKFKNNDYDGLGQLGFFQRYHLDYDSFTKLFGSAQDLTLDPFSDEYKNWEMSFFEFLAGSE